MNATVAVSGKVCLKVPAKAPFQGGVKTDQSTIRLMAKLMMPCIWRKNFKEQRFEEKKSGINDLTRARGNISKHFETVLIITGVE